MEAGIQSFAGVIIENIDGEILLVRKARQYAYAIPWCRVTHGRPLQECLKERVKDLTGLAISPVFLGPSEHIMPDAHFISFDHTARIDSQRHQYMRKGLDYLWVRPQNLFRIPMVPLTRQILERYFLKRDFEAQLSSEPKTF